MEFRRDIEQLDRAGQTRKALSLLFTKIDELLRKSEFDKVNKTLEGLIIDNYSMLLLVGFLTITLAAKSKLPYRKNLFEKIKNKIKKECSEHLNGLLVGLD